MDLVADRLTDALAALPDAPDAILVRPAMRRRASSRADCARGAGFTVDRLINRFVDYPRHVRALRGEFDLYHVLDHSYSQLALGLPAGRVVVNCHDIDTFRSILEPDRHPRPAPYRWMTQRILAGFQSAARVLCISEATRADVLRHRLVAPERVLVAYLGVDPTCRPEPDPRAEAAAEALLGTARVEAPELLHVGSTIARKRIDVLLRVFAAVRTARPGARLVRVGGPLTGTHAALAQTLGVAGAIESLPFLTREVLAAVYRRAALVLQPSDAEGFGLPIAEAMACGTPVLASDIPVLREIGGDWTAYAPVADVAAWSVAVAGLLAERATAPDLWEARRMRCVEDARRFTWEAYARTVAATYADMWRDAARAA